MQVDYGRNRTATLTAADQYVLDYMLGLIGQGHGSRTARCVLHAVKYLRTAYGLPLEDARDLVLEYENQQLLAQIVS